MIDDKLKRTLKCMQIGSLLYNVLLLILSTIISLVFCKSKNLSNFDTLTLTLKNATCIIIGFIYSIIILYSIAKSIEKSVSSNDDKYAKKHMVLMSTMRMIVFCIIFVVIINEKVFGLIGGVMFALATLGVKVGAYLAPMIESKMKS